MFWALKEKEKDADKKDEEIRVPNLAAGGESRIYQSNMKERGAKRNEKKKYNKMEKELCRPAGTSFPFIYLHISDMIFSNFNEAMKR